MTSESVDTPEFTPIDAAEKMINKHSLEINGDGLTAVYTLGNIAMPFNTEPLYRGSAGSG